VRFLPLCHSSYIWALCTLDAESGATDSEEPGLYLERVETAPFQCVIHPTYERSAQWTLRAEQTDQPEPVLYLEQVETAFFQYFIQPTYGCTAHWTLRAEHTDPEEPGLYQETGGDNFLSVRHSAYIWTLCTFDTESGAN
jgi:hypothetical protein